MPDAKWMEKHEVHERLSSALRYMGKTPTALLFIGGETDWTCDTETVFGIPVFHAIELTCWRWGAESVTCPFVPIGRNDTEITYADRKRFAEGWSEGVPHA